MNLTSFDFYLLGTIKNNVYVTQVDTKDRLRQAFAELNTNEIRQTTTTFVQSRILQYLDVNERHFELLQ